MPRNTSQKPSFECFCGDFDSAYKNLARRHTCKGLKRYGDYNQNSYCVLHYPDRSKKEEFEKALRVKFDNEDYSFFGVWFPENINLTGREFTKMVEFQYSHFSGHVDFTFSHFHREVFFDNSTFDSVAKFTSIIFADNAHFVNVRFKSLADFIGSDFHSVNFDNSVFEGEAYFSSSRFGETVTFNGVNFLEKAVFNRSVFGTESDKAFKPISSFNSANFFKVTDFSEAEFLFDIELIKSAFHQAVDFRDIRFKKTIILDEVRFKDRVTFEGINNKKIETEDALISFQKAIIEKPEYVYIKSLSVRPNWFVNANPERVSFIDIDWGFKNPSHLEDELKSLKKRGISRPKRLLTIVCRQLGQNAENNNRFEEASDFRKMAFETERLERIDQRRNWLEIANTFFTLSPNQSGVFISSQTLANRWLELVRTFPIGVLQFFYRILSGYGERWLRAFFWLLGIWVFWAFLYASPLSSFIDKQNYGLWYWIGYSLNVITFQRPDPKPADTLTMILIGLEVLVAPIQAALLILAVRRKFMR